jgi:hypothetical protein
MQTYTREKEERQGLEGRDLFKRASEKNENK